MHRKYPLTLTPITKKEALQSGVPLPSTPKGIRTSTERTGIFNPIH